MKKTIEIRLQLINSRDERVTLVVEPWGETYPFEPGEQVSIVAAGPEGGSPEIEYSVDAITYWGWEGSTVRLFQDDCELGGNDAHRNSIPEGVFPQLKHQR